MGTVVNPLVRKPAPKKLNPFEVRFGKTLVSEGMLSLLNLQAATTQAEQQQVPLAEAIVSLGLATEEDCYAMLSTVSGVPLVNLAEIEPSPLALRLVPERIARRNGILPIAVDNRTVTYATGRLWNGDADRDVTFASGRTPVAMLARPTELQAAIDRHFPKEGEIDLLLDRVRSTALIDVVDSDDANVTTDSPIIDLCNHMIARAVEAHASDVHIEPAAQGLVVRFRLDGILEPMFTLPPEAAMAVRNRYKVMARADIAVRNRPQDGSFRLRIDGLPVDVRLSTLPTIHGEKLVMRVIGGVTTPKELDGLGYDADNLARLKRALARPDGLILVTGPTGCGKSTVLYAALGHLRTGRTNIVSVEDPVERQVEGVNQIQVSTLAGNTFTSVLRSVLRQDPNVIMVGEIRDGEVAQIVGQAAYTGHLVLTSLHTADAASAVTRLLNLGLEPFKIAESLAAIVAQRLIRTLCPDCKVVPEAPVPSRFGKAFGVAPAPASAGPGCPRCKGTGYGERVPVAEVLVPDEQVRDAIGRGATATEIRLSMRKAGCPSMRARALDLVAQGVTSMEEVDRVLTADASTAVAPVPMERSRRRVLVADDDQITRMLLRLLLEKDGYEVREATNGREAIELAKRDRPDAMITDLMMPDMDGFAVIRQVRRDVALATLPVVVLTADEDPGIEKKVMAMGADDYLVKPFDAPVLLQRVAAAIGRALRETAAA